MNCINNAFIPEICNKMNYTNMEPIKQMINSYNIEKLDTLSRLIFSGERCLSNSDFEGAETMIDKAEEIDSSDYRLIRLRGIFYLLTKKFDLAIACFNEILDDPFNFMAYNHLATCYLRQNNMEKALEYADKSISLNDISLMLYVRN
jgi:tetratricopeptide (TPR) repeat protein